jgi:hypothetical protein
MLAVKEGKLSIGSYTSEVLSGFIKGLKIEFFHQISPKVRVFFMYKFRKTLGCGTALQRSANAHARTHSLHVSWFGAEWTSLPCM